MNPSDTSDTSDFPIEGSTDPSDFFVPSDSGESESTAISRFATTTSTPIVSSSSSSTVERCGPDITDWFVNFTNAALRSNQMILLREMILSPGAFQIQTQGPAMLYFASLVRPGGMWDLKVYLSLAFTLTCPTLKCNATVSLSGMCLRYDMPGNIFYGIVGRYAGFTTDTLLWAADFAQQLHSGHADEPEDQEAIGIGFDIIASPSPQYGGITYEALSQNLQKRGNKLINYPDCRICSGTWSF